MALRKGMNGLFFALGFLLCYLWVSNKSGLELFLAGIGDWSFLVFHLTGLFLPVVVCVFVESWLRRTAPAAQEHPRKKRLNTFVSYWLGFILAMFLFDF
ncbi:hypothetical protein [Paenibacillus turpanensis]|uniref:hypothetical protein n=1 Tax=Paenibacillus turpanensis TaxID=2689078 RepID=UPI00140BD144|nr:hypothetical protein [Paenibacillus turpanensis]